MVAQRPRNVRSAGKGEAGLVMDHVTISLSDVVEPGGSEQAERGPD